MLFLFLALVLNSQYALALDSGRDVRLTEWNSLPDELRQELEPLKASTFALDFEEGMNCTGTFVSNSGHIITAGHCFDRCQWGQLSRRGLEPDEIVSASLRNHDNKRWVQSLEFDTAIFGSFTCKVKINGKPEEITYLGGGRGELYPFFSGQLKKDGVYDTTIETWRTLVSQGYGAGGDFGLFKLERKDTPCRKLSDSSVLPGERLHVLSHTCIDGYGSRHARNGQMTFYSRGIEDTRNLSRFYPDLSIEPYRHSTIHAESCSSGSSVIGEDGTIKGILTQAMDVHLPREGIDTSFSSFIDVGFIKLLLKEKWGVENVACNE
ncbi:MAG: trypsin-like peptidase domain-containing protein [Oligoflexia bacterium]|nr:trypsin-like peptidase domain-containing protein [Oligoflexia bacterium]